MNQLAAKLVPIKERLAKIKGVAESVTYLKVTRHKTDDKQIKEYCTRQIKDLTRYAQISKQHFLSSND